MNGVTRHSCLPPALKFEVGVKMPPYTRKTKRPQKLGSFSFGWGVRWGKAPPFSEDHAS